MIFCLLTYFTLVASETEETPEERDLPMSGIETRIEDAPFLVSVHYKFVSENCTASEIDCANWQHICTGIIVSERHVMTAPSCFFDSHSEKLKERDPHDFLVLSGSDSKDSGRRMAVSHFCYHTDYASNSTADNYAIIFLHEYFKFGNKVKVARVPKGHYRDSSKELSALIKNHKLGYVYGWDMREDTENRQLLMVQVKLTDLQLCMEHMTNSYINKSEHFCGKPTANDLGDIGSPIVIDKVVWGFYILSGYDKLAPFLFTRIDIALEWKKLVLTSAHTNIAFHSSIMFFLLFALHAINIF